MMASVTFLSHSPPNQGKEVSLQKSKTLLSDFLPYLISFHSNLDRIIQVLQQFLYHLIVNNNSNYTEEWYVKKLYSHKYNTLKCSANIYKVIKVNRIRNT